MKKFLIYIFFACFFLNFRSAAASEGGKVILDLQPEDVSPVSAGEDGDSSVPKQIERLLKDYKHFHDLFPGDAIDGNIYDEIAKIYPGIGYRELNEKAGDIRSAVKAYRYFRKLYDDIKEKMLVPEPPPLIVDEQEYDTPYTGEYIDSPELLVINDFKKVISYGMDRRDFEAVEARAQRNIVAKGGETAGFQRLGELLKKLEWQKLFFYGVAYDDPFSGNDGLGPWVEAERASARLITEDINVREPIVRAAVHFNLKPGQMLLWSPEKNLDEPSFDFSASENLAAAEVLLPMPVRVSARDNDNIMGYTGNFAVPVKLSVKDVNKPLEVKAAVKANVCGENSCAPQAFDLRLELSPGGDTLKSAVGSFIAKTYSSLPQDELDNLKIVKAVVDQPYDGCKNETLRIVLKSDDAPEKFNIFLKSLDGGNFDRPKITIDGELITARFCSRDENASLSGRKYEVMAGVSVGRSLRQTVTARPASLWDYERGELSLGLLAMAFFGGLILNFMPCVFPVLSLKFLSLTKFGAMKENRIRRAFAFTVLGVFVAFALLCAVLLLLKYMGHALGWGMQFQNPYFLVGIMFVMILFIAQIFELINIQTPQFLLRWFNRQHTSDNFLNLLTGLFLVLVATPCTAPYLGTALGFALAGSYFDIIAVMTAVALGLSLPYVILAVSPSLGLLMPKPGAWMQSVNRLMVLMLFLTVVWLFSVLSVQTSSFAAWMQALYLVLFLLVLYLRRRTLDVVENQKESPDVREKAAKLVKSVSLALLVLFVALGMYSSQKAFAARQTEVSLSRKIKLDRELIDRELKEGNVVIVKIGADWCLTCKFNDVTVFGNTGVEAAFKYHKVRLIEVDWTNYDREVLAFMKSFGRSGLPFYILFSRSIPDGMVLPEILTEEDLVRLIKGLS